jgi:gliding motility-associated-like protein
VKKLIYIVVLLFSANLFSQTITVNDATNTPAQLVELLLGNSCVEVSNISVSSTQSVAYFDRNGSTFPINEGIIIRSGIATNTQGTYTGNNLSSVATGGSSDTFLQNLSNVSSGTNVALTDLAFLQFDFVPVSSAFSFNFLFSSNEYGEFQCLSNDIFAFELTNLSTGIITNLALIPNTANPVSVKYIKDDLYDNSCSSTNPSLFDVYNVLNPASSTLNMRGHTVVLNAASNVEPGTSYRLKLVIADYGDIEYDSAVFIAAGSFSNEFDLGTNQVMCSGDEFIIDTQLDNTYTFQWYLNDYSNPIAGEINSTYTAINSGIYLVRATKGGCVLEDYITISDLSINQPQNLQTCNTSATSYTFDLTFNNETLFGIDASIYDVFYYESAADIVANNPISNSDLNAYQSAGGQTILLKIFNSITGNFCDAVYSFDLTVTPAVNATQPADIPICEGQGNTNYTFTSLLDAEVLNGQSSSNYTITYYNSVTEASSGLGAITSVSIPNGTTSVTIGIRMQDNSNPDCFDVTSVTLIFNPLPLVDDIADPVECSQFELPTIVNGTYYQLSGGPTTPGQVQYNIGDIIDASGTYYIFAGPDANGCTNESSFYVFLVEEYIPDLDHCGTFTVPSSPFGVGAFYTASGGPSGTGVLVPAGTEFTNTTSSSSMMTLFYYAEVDNTFCKDEAFVIYIHPLPLVEDPSDVTTCDSYILPPLTNGFYNTMSDGSGITLNAGDNISVNGPNFPGTYYVVNSLAHTESSGLAGSCVDFNPFQIDLVDSSTFTSVFECGSYTLPSVAFGGYFTLPNGGGTQITDLTITSSQIVYYFSNTSVMPNCTTNLNYNITIYPIPLVDTITSSPHCDEFILPSLTNGTYYTLPGGPSIIGQQQLNAGNIIDLSGDHLPPGTYYIYNETIHNNPDGSILTCFNEIPFTISIIPLPVVDEYINLILCNPYSIPAPSVGEIYTASGGPTGSGTLVTPSDTFNTDMSFYLYYIDPITDCVVDKLFKMYYNGINLPNYPPVSVCDSYTLPVLTHIPPEQTNSYSIGYFYNSDGTNPVPNGTVFTPSNTPVSVYVYAINYGRFGVTCVEVDEIQITVSQTPNLSTLGLVFDTEECGTYVLPTLPTTTYNINYYTQPGGNAADLITDLNIENTSDVSESYTYYVHASAIGNPNCNDEIAFTFTVHPLLDITIDGGIICVDAEDPTVVYRPIWLSSGLNPAEFIVNWYLNGTLMGTGPTYLATQAGTYDVEFIKLTPNVGANCNFNNTTVTIVESNPAVADFTVSSAFENNTFITITITGGIGDYVYQLEYPDGNVGNFQTSNVFSNLATGEYYVTIFDTFGDCYPTRVGPIYIINYPKFFTPNGDGFNDNWNIWDLRYQSDAIISIFDRYGKFLKQISPASSGWDGTYNGKQLPSTDYWFTVDYLPQNSQTRQLFKAHFSMKR